MMSVDFGFMPPVHGHSRWAYEWVVQVSKSILSTISYTYGWVCLVGRTVQKVISNAWYVLQVEYTTGRDS